MFSKKKLSPAQRKLKYKFQREHNLHYCEQVSFLPEVPKTTFLYVLDWVGHEDYIYGLGATCDGIMRTIRLDRYPHALYVLTSDIESLFAFLIPYNVKLKDTGIEMMGNNFALHDLFFEPERYDKKGKLVRIETGSFSKSLRIYNVLSNVRSYESAQSYKYALVPYYWNVQKQLMLELYCRDKCIPDGICNVWINDQLVINEDMEPLHIPTLTFDLETVSTNPTRLPKGEDINDNLFTASIHDISRNILHTMVYIPVNAKDRLVFHHQLKTNHQYTMTNSMGVKVPINNRIHVFHDEIDMVRAVLHVLRYDDKIHFLSGYNTKYDINFLWNRAAFFNMHEMSHFFWNHITHFGLNQIHMDMYSIIRMMYTTYSRYTLDFVASTLLQHNKVEIDAVQLRYLFAKIQQTQDYKSVYRYLDKENQTKCVTLINTMHYNNMDTILVSELIEKTNGIQFMLDYFNGIYLPNRMVHQDRDVQIRVFTNTFVYGIRLNLFVGIFKSQYQILFDYETGESFMYDNTAFLNNILTVSDQDYGTYNPNALIRKRIPSNIRRKPPPNLHIYKTKTQRLNMNLVNDLGSDHRPLVSTTVPIATTSSSAATTDDIYFMENPADADDDEGNAAVANATLDDNTTDDENDELIHDGEFANHFNSRGNTAANQRAERVGKYPGGANFCYGNFQVQDVEEYDYITAYPFLIERDNLSDETCGVYPADYICRNYPFIKHRENFKCYVYLSHVSQNKTDSQITYYKYLYEDYHCGGDFPFTQEALAKLSTNFVLMQWVGRPGVLSRVMKHLNKVRETIKQHRKTIDSIKTALSNAYGEEFHPSFFVEEDDDNDDDDDADDDANVTEIEKKTCDTSDIDSPPNSPNVSSIGSPIDSNVGSPVGSPVRSPLNSPLNSPIVSPINSPASSRANSPAFGESIDVNNDFVNDIDSESDDDDDDAAAIADDDDEDENNINVGNRIKFYTFKSDHVGIYNNNPDDAADLSFKVNTSGIEKSMAGSAVIMDLINKCNVESTTCHNKDRAQKTFNSAFYGCIGNASKNLAASVTCKIRTTIIKSAGMVREKYGVVIHYMDTDSFFLKGIGENFCEMLNETFPFTCISQHIHPAILFIQRKTYYVMQADGFKYNLHKNGPAIWKKFIHYFYTEVRVEKLSDIFRAFETYFDNLYNEVRANPQLIQQFILFRKTIQKTYVGNPPEAQLRRHIDEKFKFLSDSSNYDIFYRFDTNIGQTRYGLYAELLDGVYTIEDINMFKFFNNVSATIFNLLLYKLRDSTKMNIHFTIDSMRIIMSSAYRKVYNKHFNTTLPYTDRMKKQDETIDIALTESRNVDVLQTRVDKDREKAERESRKRTLAEEKIEMKRLKTEATLRKKQEMADRKLAKSLEAEQKKREAAQRKYVKEQERKQNKLGRVVVVRKRLTKKEREEAKERENRLKQLSIESFFAPASASAAAADPVPSTSRAGN